MGEKGNEGDEIIIFSLRQIDCDIPKEIQCVGQLTPELLIHIISTSLDLISGGSLKCPTKLPTNIALKHRICTEVSSGIKSLGYPLECGYNQLLYPVEHQTRDLLKWIVEKLPRITNEINDDMAGLANSNVPDTSKSIVKWRKELWKIPYVSAGKPSILGVQYDHYSFDASVNNGIGIQCENANHRLLETIEADRLNKKLMITSQDFRKENQNNRKQLVHQIFKCLPSNIAPKKQREEMLDCSTSFQELVRHIAVNNAAVNNGVVRDSRFAHATVFSHDDSSDKAQRVIQTSNDGSSDGSQQVGFIGGNFHESNTAAELERRESYWEEEVNSLKENIRLLHKQVENLAMLEENLKHSLTETEKSIQQIQVETDIVEKECISKKRVLEMIPTATESIDKLQAICDKNSKKLQSLEIEWNSVRKPFEDALYLEECKKRQNVSRMSDMVVEIREHRERMIPMVKNLRDQQERILFLNGEKSKLPKNLNRSLYTHRIIDITSSLAKQNKEIEKITTDIRDLQKTINHGTNTLQRSDAIAEELIYKAASDKNDPVMIETYRRLRMLRSNFENVIEIVNNIGNSDKTYRDLETKIEQEKARLESHNFERIQSDLESVIRENSILVNRLRELSK